LFAIPGFLTSQAHANYNFTVATLIEPSAQPHRRILAVDYGTRRIGLAISDPLGITAQGIPTMLRKNKRADLAFLKEVLSSHQVCEIVVGLPLRLSGAESSSTEKAREFAELLHKEFSLPVHLWDERFTSVEANRVLRESEMSIRKRGEAVDRLSAVLILQAFLQRRQNP
jgi:putative Holliday junction resolvase